MRETKRRKFQGKGKGKGKAKKPKSYHKNKPNRNLKKYETKDQLVEEQSGNDDVPVEEDSVDQLLATFGTVRQKKKSMAVDSEEEDSGDDDGEDDRSSPGMIENDDDSNSDEERKIFLGGVENECDADGTIFIKSTEEENDLVENDPFLLHLNGNLPQSLVSNLQSLKKQATQHTLHWPALGEINVSIPTQNTAANEAQELLSDDDFVSPAKVPQLSSKFDHNILSVKPQIARHIEVANDGSQLNDLQRELFMLVNSYQDLMYSNRNLENGEHVRFIYCLHAVNHILKTRLRILHHNERINKRDEVDLPDKFRDQGLVRPKVLILVPFRDSAYRIVEIMCKLIFGCDKGNIVNRTRFIEEFTGSELFMPKTNKKPEDFEKLFSGNIDDSFRIGINFQKKSLKLYADFYSSDVIIASPLGIRMLIGAEGERDRDFDFLAAIELLIFDQTEVCFMQNWDHVVHIMNHMHLQPKDSHGTDFSRVRLWALNGWTRFYRQTLIFSSLVTPQLNAMFSGQCTNYRGAIRVTPQPPMPSISHVVVTLPHVYRRFKSSSIAGESDERFRFFTEEVLPQFAELSGVMIYIPSYFDFVRLRNYSKDKDLSFVQICEYTKDPKVARARDLFFHNEVKFLLYSERFHFYRRVNVKGIRHLVFYQPPTFAHFYSELCNMMQEWNQNSSVEDGNQSVTVVYSQYDCLSVARIVRPTRAAHIIASEKAVFMFSTDATS